MINKRVQVEGSTEQVKKYLDKNYSTAEDDTILDQAKIYYGKITVAGGALVTFWSEKVRIKVVKEADNKTEVLLTVPIIKYLIATLVLAVVMIVLFQIRNEPSLQGLIMLSIYFLIASIIVQGISLVYRLYVFAKQLKKGILTYVSKHK